MNTSPVQNQKSQPPPLPGRFVFGPMPEGHSPALVIETLLKYPGRIIHELQNNWRTTLALCLLLLALLGMAAYGVVVGSFSGGAQMWIAPAKITIGTLLSMLICFPSLYILACLSGVDARLRTLAGVFFAAVGLGALLLIGFAPVAWIFSQSSDSVAFMAAVHIGFLGNRNIVGAAITGRNGTISDRLRAKSLETLGIRLRGRLFANDDYAASNRRQISPLPSEREKIFSRALGRNSSRRIIKK
jgi:hypothetical protein